MQIAYSTYALQGVDPFKAVARVTLTPAAASGR